MQPIDHTNLHRTAKYFMDSGQAETAEAALALLQDFGLSVHVSADAARSAEGQIALLTLVNLARRTMLGGVEVIGLEDWPCLIRLTGASTMRAAVVELGGSCVAQPSGEWPAALIGHVETAPDKRPRWQLQWQGWRGGVSPWRLGHLIEGPAIALAPAMAAAACTSELFSYHAGDHPMAGRRNSGISLWNPGSDWTKPDPAEAPLSFLPSRLWLIGLGNLGQAYSWLLACLPYADPSELELMLQDDDVMAISNDSTSLLATLDAVGQKKTRWVAGWLERRGFSTLIEERRFGAWTQRTADEPGVALCGVDNAPTRAALEKAGFDLIVEAGLGGGPEAFRSFAMHSFPGPNRADEIWSKDIGQAEADLSAMPAYKALREQGMEECGLAQLASRTVGVPYVGLIAGGIVIADLLRRLHGVPGFDLVAGSVISLEDIEASFGVSTPYAQGYASASAS